MLAHSHNYLTTVSLRALGRRCWASQCLRRALECGRSHPEKRITAHGLSPEQLCFVRIQLKPIGRHPQVNVRVRVVQWSTTYQHQIQLVRDSTIQYRSIVVRFYLEYQSPRKLGRKTIYKAFLDEVQPRFNSRTASPTSKTCICTILLLLLFIKINSKEHRRFKILEALAH